LDSPPSCELDQTKSLPTLSRRASAPNLVSMPDHTHQPADARSRIPHVGTYRRVLPVSLERMYENALDWAHLPFLHASSFAAIECLEAGSSGWRARVTSQAGVVSEIELHLDRHIRRWITRTLEGANAGAEIWTHAFPIAARRTDIVVDFFVPDVTADARAKVGAALGALYERLYDEDVAMMVERQRELDRRIDGGRLNETMVLGRRDALSFPLEIEFRGRPLIVCAATTAADAPLIVYPARCPHQLGPLSSVPVDGVVTCPWHGYRFALATGECLTGSACRLDLWACAEVDARGQVVVRAKS